jgi:hypothetical protein
MVISTTASMTSCHTPQETIAVIKNIPFFHDCAHSAKSNLAEIDSLILDEKNGNVLDFTSQLHCGMIASL